MLNANGKKVFDKVKIDKANKVMQADIDVTEGKIIISDSCEGEGCKKVHSLISSISIK